MTSLLFNLSLFLTLFATGGFITYLFKQNKNIFRWAAFSLLAGFVLHTLFIIFEYYHLGTAPVITLKAALSFFSWTIIAAYFILHLKFKLMILGSFVAPFAACLMIISSSLPMTEIHLHPMLLSIWLPIHIGTAFIGNGMFAIMFIAAGMYLIQEHHIKKKKFGAIYNRLPSLETLDSINLHSLIYGFPFLTLGILTGSIYAQQALGSYWRWDPKEVWTLITWIFYAALLHERLAVGLRGRRAAWLAIIAFVILFFTFLGANLWLSDYHSFKNLKGVKVL